ncbi:MAG TPA: hypothetical protein VND94_23260 [Terriglobia bacterium]|nr:hypothetical protein [Terriglobia bacterium]
MLRDMTCRSFRQYGAIRLARPVKSARVSFYDDLPPAREAGHAMNNPRNERIIPAGLQKDYQHGASTKR